MPPKNEPRCHRAATCAIGLTLSLAAAASAAGTREWISFDNSPPGTAPSVKNIAEKSSLSKSVFEVELHGMWVQHRTIPGTNETMQVVSLAGSSALATNELGRPELPGISLRLACTRYRADGTTNVDDLLLMLASFGPCA